MDFESWILMIITWLVVSLYNCYKMKCKSVKEIIYKFCSKLLDAFFMLVCSGINDQRKGFLYTLLTLSSFLFWDLYQKEIIGLTIVEEKVEPFPTNCELLAAGFRVWRRPNYKLNCGDYFSPEELYYETKIKRKN